MAKKLKAVKRRNPGPVAFMGPYRPVPLDGKRDISLLQSESLPVQTIPVSGEICPQRGMCLKGPWTYEVTAVIVTINAAERLPVILELLRRQTVKPFILLIDTGSNPQQFSRIESMRSQDLEVHALRLNGVLNSSEPISMAMDVATALCRTRFMFCTHDDVFLRSRVALQYMRDLASVARVAGHAMTPRPHDDWRGMVSHSCTMIDVDWLIDQGISWNMRRGQRLFGIQQTNSMEKYDNWPDTETTINYLLRLKGVQPFLTGTEKNWQRTWDGLIDHCRSAGSNDIYKPGDPSVRSREWLRDAQANAWQRIREWDDDPCPDADPLPISPPDPIMCIPSFTKGHYG